MRSAASAAAERGAQRGGKACAPENGDGHCPAPPPGTPEESGRTGRQSRFGSQFGLRTAGNMHPASSMSQKTRRPCAVRALRPAPPGDGHAPSPSGVRATTQPAMPREAAPTRGSSPHGVSTRSAEVAVTDRDFPLN